MNDLTRSHGVIGIVYLCIDSPHTHTHTSIGGSATAVAPQIYTAGADLQHAIDKPAASKSITI